MNSPRTPHARPAEHHAHALLVREGGVPYVPSSTRDPWESWAELMEVVEALCARWPERRHSLPTGSFRL
jgi:hypothetical protein